MVYSKAHPRPSSPKLTNTMNPLQFLFLISFLLFLLKLSISSRLITLFGLIRVPYTK